MLRNFTLDFFFGSQALVFDRVVEMWRKVAVYVPGVGGGAPAVRETPKNK